MPSSALPRRRSARPSWATGLRALAAIVGAVILAAGVLAARQGRSQAQLLQDGIALMETKGEYRAAARVFEAVSRGPDRGLAARGLLYLGLAHEHLATAEARAAYQRIISGFADQPLIVAQARDRLANLGVPRLNPLASAVTARRLWGTDFTPLGPPSRDGRLLPGVNENSELAVRDLATLDIRRLAPTSDDEGLISALFSPDGNQVASVWAVWDRPGSLPYEVRVTAASGERSRVVHGHEAVHGTLAGWTPDGRVLMVYFARADGTGEIVAVDLATEDARVVVRLDARVFSNLALSPDGAFVVFDAAGAPARGDYDIHIVEVATGRVASLVEHPANDVFPLWTADGRVLFASDRTGSLGLWLVEVESARVVGEPQIVRREMGAMLSPAGLGANGSLYYRLNEGLVEVQTSTLDPARGTASAPVPVARRVQGINLFPDWAPDGRRLVYTSRRGQLPFTAGGQALVIADVQSGEESVLTTQVANMAMPRWSPDGRSIAVLSGSDDGGGLHRVDAGTGAVETIARAEAGQPGFGPVEWTPDGRALIYRRGLRRIVRRDLQSGEEQTLHEVSEDRRLWNPALSRDGTLVAVPEWRDQTEAQLVVVPLDGGSPRTIFFAKKPDTFAVEGWSAGDADVFIVFFTATDPDVPRALLRVPVSGGPPVPTGLVVPTMRNVRVSPDGLRVAFTAGWPTRAAWVLENFLPPPRAVAVRAPARRQAGP